MWKNIPFGAKITIIIAFIFMIPAVISDYISFIPKITSIFLAMLGSITIFFLWFKYGRVSKK
ncbi:hypothetical protein KAS41_01605 [Candidatus Parcubacteria bacterium]|nr:hypothetical protein [Candidatus Parcubacteria bacterium]